MGMPGIGIELSPGRGRPVSLAPLFDFSGPALPLGARLTRASAARRFAAGGALITVAADVPRFDRDPVTGATRGLLIEAAATNLLPWSDRIDLFGERSQCSAISNVGPAPDGTGGFGRLVPAVGSGVFPYAADTSVPKSAGTTYTLSAFARYETIRWLLLSGGLYGDARFAWFDLANGAVGTVGANAIGAAITRIDATTCRIAVTFTGTSSPYCLLAPVKADATFGADYAAGDSAGVWGVMLETGAKASSAVATAGSAVTRAADVLTLEWRGRGVADGAITVRYTFDDGSAQDVATVVAGGTAGVPTTLNRRWLRRAEKL